MDIQKGRKIIVLQLAGGLGNQLWQLAYAITLKKKFDFDSIIFDLSWYKENKVRNFELNNFVLPEYFSEQMINIRGYRSFKALSFIYSKIRGLYFKLHNIYIDNKLIVLYEKGYYITHNNVPEISKIKTNTIFMSGYFQNYHLIEGVLPYLRNILVPKEETLSREYYELLKVIKSDANSVAVSVRCGSDFIKLNWNICGVKYFASAMSKFPKGKFYIFSDDIGSARKMFDGKNVQLVPQLSAVEQLMLMKECRAFILSNSSFSYWGALLSENHGKIVFPEKWFPYLKTEDSHILFGDYELNEE